MKSPLLIGTNVGLDLTFAQHHFTNPTISKAFCHYTGDFEHLDE